MIALGSKILRRQRDLDAFMSDVGGRPGVPWQPAFLAAMAGKLDITILDRSDTALPRHALKASHPRMVLVIDAPLGDTLSSPGPASWRSTGTWSLLRPAACVIHATVATVEQYLGPVAVAIKAGPVLGITCAPERVADWQWLVRPWCPSVFTLASEPSL